MTVGGGRVATRIEITVDRDGRVTVETRGRGGSCREASRFRRGGHRAPRTSERLTAEPHQGQDGRQESSASRAGPSRGPHSPSRPPHRQPEEPRPQTLAEPPQPPNSGAPPSAAAIVVSREHDDAVVEIARCAAARPGCSPPGTPTVASTCRAAPLSPSAADLDRRRRPGPRRAGHARRDGGDPGPAQLPPPLPGLARGRPGARHPALRREARAAPSSSPSCRRWCASRRSSRRSSSSPSTSRLAATSSRRSPAASPPSRGSCQAATTSGRSFDAAAGLARRRGRGGLRPSPVRHGRLGRAPLWEIKAGGFREVGPRWPCTAAARRRSPARAAWRRAEGVLLAGPSASGRPAGVRARGVLLLGPPGSGKSQFAKGAPFNG